MVVSAVRAEPRAQQQAIATRKGWIDAAAGLPRRTLAASVTAAYERGYRGGAAFRLEQQVTRMPAMPRVLHMKC